MPSKNKLSLAVQYADSSLAATLTRPLLRRWTQAALQAPAELTLRFVDEAEGRALNRDYRGKDYATNVLTFAYDEDDVGAPHAPVRADIVFCCPVLQAEALAQGKPLLAHAAHLVVHGVLHAQGYDHEDDADASEMEALEVAVLAGLGLPDPYRTDTGPGSRANSPHQP